MELKLSKGTATLKSSYTRKMAKEVSRIISEGVEMTSESEGTGKESKNKSITKGFNITASDKANDYVLCNMIEKLEYNEETYDKITVEILDELDNKDFVLIKEAIDTLAGEKVKVKND